MYEPPLPARTLPGPSPGADRHAARPGHPRRRRRHREGDDRPGGRFGRPPGPADDVPVAEATPAVTPAPTNAPATDASNYGTQQNYSAGSTVSAPQIYAGPTLPPLRHPRRHAVHLSAV